ncbi:MAG: TonB-dependent receptor [Sphingomonas sp. 28-66-16]|nr:MAG: TonB-dependent receptor [Sphingomonas sp. 28-66-16]
MTNFRIARIALALSAASGGFAAAAHAQTAPAPANTAAESASSDVTDIVVTAERRSENLQKVPLSVGVVSGDTLRDIQSGGEDLLALAGRVPGLYAETTTGRIFPRFYIRGLGNIDFYLGASQPVEIIQDDVILEHVVLKSNPVYDTRQIEVLRGPQGTLFGRNTTAGIIKFDSIQPGQDFSARGTLSIGEYNTVSFDGGVGGPIVKDKIAFRVSGLYQHRDNWVTNTYTGASADGTTSLSNKLGGFDERDARVQLLFTPTAALSINVAAHLRDYNGTSTIFHRGGLQLGSNSVAAEPRNLIALDEGRGNLQGYNTRGASIRAAYDFGPATLTSISAYEHTSGFSRGDTDGGAAALFPVGGAPNGFGQSQGRVLGLDQYSEELRLASNGDTRFKWQIGGLYFDSRDDTRFDQRAFLIGTNPNNFVVLHDINTSWAIFGQASYKLLDSLTVTGGVRVTNDTKRTILTQTANTAAGVSTYAGRRDVGLSDTLPSWDASLLYQIDPDASLYARVARGFRGPTIQGRSAVFNADFTTANSETILSFEGGVKSTLFDKTLRFNASIFQYTVDNIQLNGNDSNGNGVLFNAAKANAYGVEAEIDWRPIPNLTLGLGASALHSEIRDSRVYAQVCALNGSVTCTVLDPVIRVGPNYFAQINGNPLPNAPRYNFDFNARYDLPVGRHGKLFAATDWNVQGYTNLVLYRTREFFADGNYEGGLKIGYQGDDGAYEIAVFARNITDAKNLKGVIENYRAAVFNEPRVIGVTFSGRLR